MDEKSYMKKSHIFITVVTIKLPQARIFVKLWV